MPRYVAGVVAGGLLCSFLSVHAQSIDYDPRRANELRACDDHQYRGRTAEAKQCYSLLLDQSRSAAVRAEAAWQLGDVQRANQLFRAALRGAERPVQTRVRWGYLYLQTHQYADAQKLFSEALELSPNDIQARLGMAHVYADQFEGEARPLIEQLLSEDDQIFAAHLLAARMSLEEGRLDDADRSLDRAAKIADAKQLPPLEVYSLRAVFDLMRGRDSAAMHRDAWVRRVLGYNPRYGAVYEQLARFEVTRRRYREATPLLRKAVEIQPDLWSAHAQLGANLLRLGEIDEARQHLVAAYEGDPYSPTIVNTLRLLDRVNEVETSVAKIPLPTGAPEDVADVEVRLRLNRKESQALRPYVLEVARDSITAFSQRYGFRPREPVTVELYPDHDDFAVRVAALPGIGLLGVTFGYLVAMDSPSGRATGDFNWGSTLWHEMAHVFTLEMTDHRVPRWLSEGVSVFEEWRTGPAPGVVVTPDVITALEQNLLLPVAQLDAGFIRPQYPNQVQVSYTQAGLICLFIEQRWGFEQLPALLRQFTRETTTQAAIEATFKLPAAEFDRQFVEFVRQRYATLLARREDWQKSYRAALKARNEQRWPDVIAPARQAIEIYPEHTGPDSPYLILAQALEKTGDRNGATDVVLQYRKAGGWEPGALRELAAWLVAANRREEAIDALAAVNYSDPLNHEQHLTLGEQLLAAGRAEDSMREFQVSLALNGLNAAMANFGMARALRVLGDMPASRRHLLDALATAPHYKPAQDLLLQMVEERQE
ncbi:MAG TPA: tetratricopeptide repeat protein [Povalibacter sp.]|nr:tetratricopeptide repeat protein [Povalibacter sp.]